MTTFEAGREARARRAYETGRFHHAVRRAAPLVPLLALALLGCAPSREVLACAGALLVVVVLLLWRGQDWGVGVGPGIVAGLVPLLFPSLVQAGGHLCISGGCLLLPSVCAAGGLLGGVLLGILAPLATTWPNGAFHRGLLGG